ncbi:MAG: DNA polymerase III subunit delta [Lentimicrobium sp.]|nr:DNA polymerase III subunit delta [Lentimicrobium sp.]
MAADYKQILSNIRKRIYAPIYLLHGEEDYYIDLISDAIENEVLNEMEKEFNLSVLYGRDVNAQTIVDYAKRYPMMASHQVVIVKEAQEIRNLDDLQTYAANPLPSTLLVLCHKHKKYDKRKVLAKNIDSKGVLFESSRLYEDKIPAWITAQVEAAGYTISDKACNMMASFLGNDLSKINNELSKLYINLPKGSQINEKIVESNIGISKDYNIFELQNALARRDVLKANQIAAYFAANPRENPIVKNVILLYTFFSKVLVIQAMAGKPDQEVNAIAGLTPYSGQNHRLAARNYTLAKTAEIISLLREYDLKAKGVDISSFSTDDGELLKELIYRIMH